MEADALPGPTVDNNKQPWDAAALAELCAIRLWQLSVPSTLEDGCEAMAMMPTHEWLIYEDDEQLHIFESMWIPCLSLLDPGGALSPLLHTGHELSACPRDPDLGRGMSSVLAHVIQALVEHELSACPRDPVLSGARAQCMPT
ncbi:hypothetical protein NDU88_007561 [Pleurodeles waltl]|uniref:Uncharacterized protein n=1 Tax=Pleurodeles waltl TaxID=8319 RepID=A0AAV7LY32_PLEWA|nr:hypothetical protein NDU88_007561 [Pleurodeles waltl]